MQKKIVAVMDKFDAFNPAHTPSKGVKGGELVVYTATALEMKLGKTAEPEIKRHHGYFNLQKGQKK